MSFLYNQKPLLIDSFEVLYNLPADSYDIFKLEPYGNFSNIPKSNTVFNIKNREHKNWFRNLNGNKRIILLFSKFIAEKSSKAIICFSAPDNSKIWLNGKALCIHSGYYKTTYVACNVKSGKNIIWVEIFSPSENDSMSIQILDYENEMSDEITSLSVTGNINQRENLFNVNLVQFITPETPHTNNDVISFMHIANDASIFENTYKFKVYDNVKDYCFTLNAKLNEVVNFNIADHIKSYDLNLLHVTFVFEFTRKDGRIYTQEQSFIPRDCEKEKQEIISQAEKLAKNSDNFVKAQILGRIEFMESSSIGVYPLTKFWTVLELNKIIQQLGNDKYDYSLLYNPGVHELYYQSSLDNKYEQIRVWIPEKYDTNKKYPVILNLATAQYSGICFSVNDLPEDCIFVDITLRGVLCGSYISEASFFDVFKQIKKWYSIDENRVYLTGCSSGGFAVWSIMQNYPHIVAAAYPLVGLPYMPEIKNTDNIPKIAFVSDKDFIMEGIADAILDKITENKNFVRIKFENMLHFHFNPHCINKKVIAWLLQHRLNLYPNNIFFRTKRNRHLESYWLKLHRISKYCDFAQVEANLDNKGINIFVKDATGITIKIPPQIDKSQFEVKINNQTFSFVNFRKDEICFSQHNKIWQIISKDNIVLSDCRKGTGLLDVYMEQLKIIVPYNAENEILECAKRFSSPKSNGFDPNIYTKYPIIVDCIDCLNEKINLIIFDHNNSSNIIKKLRNSINFSHLIYGRNDISDDYCIMQALPHPLDNSKTILLISFNNVTILRKNIFTRKVILPTYHNGLHEYLNSRAIVFRNNKYVVIKK